MGVPALEGVPITGVLGDQQAALFGQAGFDLGDAKNTYGTGCFLLMNTGEKAVTSSHGLLTTLAYQLEGQPAVYALEGSVSVGGAVVQWLRDNLELIKSASEVEAVAATVEDNGGCYLVPAFAGLYAPYWRDDARGVVCGLTRFVTKAHICRAALEAIAFPGQSTTPPPSMVSAAPIFVGRVGANKEVREPPLLLLLLWVVVGRRAIVRARTVPIARRTGREFE